MLSKSKAGYPKGFCVEERDISWLCMGTVQGMCFVVLDTRKTTVNSAKETSPRSSQRMNRKLGMRMILLSTIDNTGETLEVSD